jgi:hypothetical protein
MGRAFLDVRGKAEHNPNAARGQRKPLDLAVARHILHDT